MKQLLLWLWVTSTVSATAQTILVKDDLSQKPISGVLIFDDSKQKQTITNENGQASLSLFSANDIINLQMLGYKTVRISWNDLRVAQFTIAMSENTLSLDEVIVSANRWEQNLREVSTTIAKVDAEVVKFQNPQTAADLLSLSNRVFVQKSQLGGGSPMIRGFATNRVLLVVDGVRMNNAIFRSGNVQNVISLDANAIEETEVIFGPGSVLYGSDAIGGVMDFHTLKPVLSNKGVVVSGNVLARYSSANNENTGHADVNIGLRKWAFVTSATKADYDDLTMGSYGPQDYTRPDFVVRENDTDVVRINPNPNVQVGSGFEQVNLMQKVRFKPTDTWDVLYAFHYAKSSNVPRYDRLILRNSNNALSQGDWYYGPQKWVLHNVRVENTQPTAISNHAKLTLAYQTAEESRHTRSFGSANRTNRFENVEATSLNLDVDKELTLNSTLFYGAEYIHNTLHSTAFRNNVLNGAITPASTRYPDGAEWQSAAAYMSLKIKLSEKWILNASNRFSYIRSNARFDTAFFDLPKTQTTLVNRALNGSIGLVHNPNEKTKYYANLSTGFRAPNIDDLGKVFDSSPGNVVVPNPELEAEIAYSAEVGFASVLNQSLKVDAAMYYSIIDNAIARGAFTLNGQDSIDYEGTLSQVQAQQNISSVRVYGVQAGLIWNIAKSITLSSNINYQKGKERDVVTGRNAAPTHVAPLFGATHLVFKKKKWMADVYTQYNGEISYRNLALTERADAHLYATDKNGNPYAPAWITLNMKTSYTLFDTLTIDAGIENLLDKRYRPYSSGITAPGRNVIVSLRATL